LHVCRRGKKKSLDTFRIGGVWHETAIPYHSAFKGAKIMNDNRIDPSIPLQDEIDGQAFFDALVNNQIEAEAFDALENLDYSTAAKVWRAIRAAD
jgi:hypothetical protein